MKRCNLIKRFFIGLLLIVVLILPIHKNDGASL